MESSIRMTTVKKLNFYIDTVVKSSKENLQLCIVVYPDGTIKEESISDYSYEAAGLVIYIRRINDPVNPLNQRKAKTELNIGFASLPNDFFSDEKKIIPGSEEHLRLSGIGVTKESIPRIKKNHNPKKRKLPTIFETLEQAKDAGWEPCHEWPVCFNAGNFAIFKRDVSGPNYIGYDYELVIQEYCFNGHDYVWRDRYVVGNSRPVWTGPENDKKFTNVFHPDDIEAGYDSPWWQLAISQEKEKELKEKNKIYRDWVSVENQTVRNWLIEGCPTPIPEEINMMKKASGLSWTEWKYSVLSDEELKRRLMNHYTMLFKRQLKNENLPFKGECEENLFSFLHREINRDEIIMLLKTSSHIEAFNKVMKA